MVRVERDPKRAEADTHVTLSRGSAQKSVPPAYSRVQLESSVTMSRFSPIFTSNGVEAIDSASLVPYMW